MTGLLEWRERLRTFYHTYKLTLQFLVRFFLSFGCYWTVFSGIGFAGQFPGMPAALLLAAISMLFPSRYIGLFVCALINFCCYSVSFETGITASLSSFLIVVCYFLIGPDERILLAVSFLACNLNVSACIPITAALLFGPSALVSIESGVLLYGLVTEVRQSYSVLASYNTGVNSLEKIRTILQGIAQNPRVWMLFAACLITFMIVWLIRRLPTAHAWNSAIPVGLLTFIFIVLFAGFYLDVSLSILGLVIGAVLGTGTSLLAELFRFTPDGSRVEIFEYEDENYYYYVKAIPKMALSVSSMKVTNITDYAEEEPLLEDDFPEPEDLDLENERGGQDAGH